MTSAVQSVPIQTAQALREPIIYMAKKFSAPYCTESSPPNPCRQHDIMILFTWTMPCGKVKLKVEDEDEDDDEDNSGSGDNGESKLVFVLRSRHEALVGTMGDPLLKC